MLMRWPNSSSQSDGRANRPQGDGRRVAITLHSSAPLAERHQTKLGPLASRTHDRLLPVRTIEGIDAHGPQPTSEAEVCAAVRLHQTGRPCTDVRTEMALHVLAYNIKRLVSLIGVQRLLANSEPTLATMWPGTFAGARCET